MARVPDAARRRFFSGSPLDTFIEQLLFFPLKIGKDQKKYIFSRPQSYLFPAKIGSGADSCGGIHPPAIFKHVFDEYNFFIISNLFENVRTKYIIFGETLKIRGRKF